MECAGGHQCGASVQMNQSARVQKKNGLRNSVRAAGRLGSDPAKYPQKCHRVKNVTIKIFRSSSLKLKMKRTSSSSDLADANTVTSSNKKFKQSVTMSSSDSDAVMDGKPAAAEVDEKLYSRQLYVMGHEAQRRMMSSRAVVIGLSGLASNVVLCDPEKPNSFDLGGNFYLTEEDVQQTTDGKSRAELCQSKLAALNEYVKVEVASEVSSLKDEAALLNLIQGASCVVVTVPLSTPLLCAIDEKCRASNVCFIYSLSTGVFGKVFCDFGESFVIADKDGENPATSQVENILTSNPAVVKVLEDQGRHGLETGDHVTFSRVKGLDGMLSDNKATYEVKVTGPFTFELVNMDASQCSEVASQGYITQVKTPVTASFRSYREALADHGELMMSDFAKFDRPPLLHLAYRALASYAESHDMVYPMPGDMAAAKEGDNNAAAERIILHLASGSRSILSPMCATLGGIVGQEVLKSCSGKFTPINGFFTLTQMNAYQNLNYFLIGAGAIGCEMLKNWALMGVACGEKGKIHITDMDRIEKSNLSRQFLFRNSDINEFKSATAARAAKAMNPSMNIVPYQEKVGADTEEIFGDDFYDN
ncbi:ubiquitin-activating enzyme E1 [Skeletonema marinoi]|uniref:Ubiquitin-activating enzyme E1 n=1 Tax=Skeletonema marinoi TaxID=267567 RepID=A0AAD9DI76_9STRA|nr:ubiquitin-activating enzyme E1 [Skeletonema marinoi]